MQHSARYVVMFAAAVCVFCSVFVAGSAVLLKDRQEAKSGTEVFRIGGDGKECARGGLEQDVVNHSFVVERQRSQGLGQGKHHVVVGHGQQFAAPRLEPLGLGQ